MFPNRELWVLLNDRLQSPKNRSTSAASKVKSRGRPRVRPLSQKTPQEPKKSKTLELKNPLFKMSDNSEKSLLPRRQTRASTTTSPIVTFADPEPRTRRRKSGGSLSARKLTNIKFDDSVVTKEEIPERVTPEGESNNNTKPRKQKNRENPGVEAIDNSEPLKKRRRTNPQVVVDLEDSEVFEVKQEELSDVESLQDTIQTTMNTISMNHLNESGFDADVSNNTAAVNNENNQNVNNRAKNRILMRGRRRHNVIKVEDAGGTHEGLPEGLEDRGSTKVTSTPTERLPDLDDTEPRDTKMKCLSEIISDVFDLKAPEAEERSYYLLKQVLKEYKREKKVEGLEREAARRKYERAVSSNIQGIKLILSRMNRRKLTVDQTTQTDREFLEEVKGKKKKSTAKIPKLEVPPTVTEDNPSGGKQQSSDAPAGHLTKKILVDSANGSNDQPGSVFQRLGNRTESKSSKIAKPKHWWEKSPENPAPEPLSFVELQREMIERHQKNCNIVIEGFRGSWDSLEDDINVYFRKKIGINAPVVKVLVAGKSLVVTVGSYFIKNRILSRRSQAERSHVYIDSDYTGREKKVQKWLEVEKRRRIKAGGTARVAYGRINLDGDWWYWNDLEGGLTRYKFRPELLLREKSAAME